MPTANEEMLQAAMEQETRDVERKLARAREELRAEKKRVKHLMKELDAAEARLEFSDAFEAEVDWKKVNLPESSPGGDTTAILVLCDWHWAESVDLATTAGANQFNPKIARKRVKTCYEKFARMLEWSQKFGEIRHVVMACLGDFITGTIHDDLAETNFMSPTEECLEIRDHLCSGIRFASELPGIEKVDVITCQGNHGRSTPKKRIKTYHQNSFEWMTYNFMAREFEGNENVHFHIGKGYHNWLKVQGMNLRAHHGDFLKFGGGIGGISVTVNKSIAAWNKRKHADLDIFGHFHQFVDHWNWVCCGSLKGYDEFSVSIKADFQPPTQTLILVSKRYGKTAAIPIFLE